MREYLFVYGTLLHGSPEPEVNRTVRRYCDDAGAASVAGRLYRISWYPGFVPGSDIQGRVEGRLLHLREAERCWPVFDAYEGYRPDAPDAGLFVRRRITVHREPSGATLEAWIYVYRGPLGRARPVDRWPPGNGRQAWP